MDSRRDAIRLMVLVLVSIFAVELPLLVGFHLYVYLANPFVEAVIVASIMAVVLVPALYFLIFKKLVEKNVKLKAAEIKLLSAHDELEILVSNRTKALSVSNADLETSIGQLKTRQQEIEILGDMAKMFQACRNFEETFKVAEYELPRLFPDHAGALYLMKSSKNQLDRAMTWGRAPAAADSFGPDGCWALRFGKPHHYDGNSGAVACDHVTAGSSDENLCLPTSAYGETVGVLTL